MGSRAANDPWVAARERAVGAMRRPVADHLRDTEEIGPAGDAYRIAQRTGRIEDVRRQAQGLRGPAPPRHDSDGVAAHWPDSAPAGNDVPLIGQDPPLLTLDLRGQVRPASPYAATLVEHVQERIAR